MNSPSLSLPLLTDAVCCLYTKYLERKAHRDDLILTNQKLVKWIVYRHFKTYARCEADYDDLEAVGLRGLFYAARKFDPTRGVKFSTYATVSIRNVLINHTKREKLRALPIIAGVESYSVPDMKGIEAQELAEDLECLQGKLEILRGELSPIEEQILTLYMAGQSRHDIAKKLHRHYRNINLHFQRIVHLARELVS